jgi:hypothetical protein
MSLTVSAPTERAVIRPLNGPLTGRRYSVVEKFRHVT